MYLIRLDDASEYMNMDNWDRIEQMLDRHNVRPIVGIIPMNKDPYLLQFEKDLVFWEKAQCWQKKGWRIALHGYDHVCSSNCAGINPVHNRSEFAGFSLEIQREKIRYGIRVLKEHGVYPTMFFAPSHTFDENTLEALRIESDIRIISDTIANDTYCCNGFTFVPQQSGRVRKLPFKVSTICLHPNFSSESEFLEIEAFLKNHSDEFLDPNAIVTTARKRNMLDYVCKTAYFLRRKRIRHSS